MYKIGEGDTSIQYPGVNTVAYSGKLTKQEELDNPMKELGDLNTERKKFLFTAGGSGVTGAALIGGGAALAFLTTNPIGWGASIGLGVIAVIVAGISFLLAQAKSRLIDQKEAVESWKKWEVKENSGTKKFETQEQLSASTPVKKGDVEKTDDRSGWLFTE